MLHDTPLSAEEIAKALGGHREGAGWRCQCPAHNDKNPSLDISEKSGKVVFICRAGCTQDAVLAVLKERGHWRSGNGKLNGRANGHSSHASRQSRKLVATYDYVDEGGELLFQVCRFEPGRTKPKDFFQRRKPRADDPPSRISDGWAWDKHGVLEVPYRLPELIEAIANSFAVFIVEGEKDCDRLAEIRIVATCNAGGAGKWGDAHAAHLKGANVIVIPDNDDPGRKHADAVAASLKGIAHRVRVLELPGLPEKEDVSWWLEKGGGTAARLWELAERAPDWQPSKDAPPGQKPHYAGPSRTIDEVIEIFQRWLYQPDPLPLYAMFGTIAANQLPGDPVWLGDIRPPSSGKTELLNALLPLPDVYEAATLTPAALLSGTPARQVRKGAKGGLLQEIGKFGILVAKDFTSVLSMRPDAKSELLAALREIYDGRWTRHLGTDGGRTLAWAGKVGFVFGCTEAIDDHHGVMSELGPRFLLCRSPAADREQITMARKHAGTQTIEMRRELAEAVQGLFAGPRSEPRALTDAEWDVLSDIAWRAVRLRSAVIRDRRSREVEAIHGNEGPARLALALERVIAGLDTLKVDRRTSFEVVRRLARDSVPLIRRRALELLEESSVPVETSAAASTLGLPTNTVRRALEDLTAHGLATRREQGSGKSHLWEATS